MSESSQTFLDMDKSIIKSNLNKVDIWTTNEQNLNKKIITFEN